MSDSFVKPFHEFLRQIFVDQVDQDHRIHVLWIVNMQGCNSLLKSGGGGRGRHGHLSVMMSGAGDKYLDPVCNIFIATTQHQ